MKKKFVLTLALVLMVAVTLTAAPIELGGEFTASRTFNFDPSSITAASSLELDGLSVSGDFWKISVKGDVVSGAGLVAFGEDTNEATAEIYLDKALAEQGIDMGDLAITLGVGFKTNAGLLHVYDGDPTVELEMLGVLLEGTTDITVGYGTMVTAKGSLNFDTTNKPFALSAKFAPVDGVEATVGFTNYAVGDTKGGIAGSVAVDVAALAGIEDFALAAYVYDVFYLDSKDNHIDAKLAATYADVGLTLAMYNKIATVNQTDLSVKVAYSGIENVGLSAKLSLGDLTGTLTTTIEAGANYTMGGVKYALDTKYVVDGNFSLTPSVTIEF